MSSPQLQNEISNIHGKCGILMASLIDPLSEFINKITGIDGINAIGFYYESNLRGTIKHTVMLFNTYDNDPIPWLRLGIQMDLFLASPFVKKIIFYPINTDQFRDKIFQTLVIETISVNSHELHDKNLSYTAMLLHIAGITGNDVDRITGRILTGYNLVNRLLCNLMGIKVENFKHEDSLRTNLISCPLLKPSISISSLSGKISDSDVMYVIEESRREITKLIAVFVDLFTSHVPFRNNILRMNVKSHIDLIPLFTREEELTSMIVGGLQTGIISNKNLNEIIHDLSNERSKLVSSVPNLSLSINPNKNINIVDESIPCTFQLPLVSQNTEPLRDLGVYINHIVDSFDNPNVLIVNLGGMISSYNDAIRGTNLPKIIIPGVSQGDHTLSRQSIVTIPGNSKGGNAEIPITSRSIAMYNSNLTSLSEEQLLDTLVYIDSLRNTDGTGDTRFANLQNEITHELAQRRKGKIIQ